MKLLFVHGAGGGGDLWKYQTAYFPGSIAVDLPGHPAGQGFQSIEDYAGWVKGFVYARDLAPVVLTGHSMGGAICQWLAIHEPGMVRALVLTSTGARLRVSAQIFQALDGDYEKAVDFMLQFSFGPEASAALRQEAKSLRLNVPAAVVRGDYQACDKFDVMDRLGAIAVPTLIICGTEDKMTPVKYSQHIHSQIPGSRLELIPGGGHNVMLEKPDQFNGAVESFLNSLEGESHDSK